MTEPRYEDPLQRYYEIFDPTHDRMRDELLAALPEQAPRNKFRNQDAAVLQRKQVWRAHPRLAVAALLLVTIGLSAFFRSASTQSVYGMEHLHERLLTVRSLYLQGWMYMEITTEEGEEKVEKFPIEQYFGRPNYIAYTGYAFESPGGGKPTRVSRTSTASDDKRTIVVLHDDKTAFLAAMPRDPFDVELLVEAQIQSNLASQFLQGHASAYRKLRSEKAEEMMCDLYVCDIPDFQRTAGRHYIWLNPQTGFPVKIESCEVDEEGKEQLAQSVRVRVNEEPPIELFSFCAPEGYKVIDTRTITEDNVEELSSELTATLTKNDPVVGTKLSYFGAGGSDTSWLATWHALRIDDRAALVCWHQYDTDEDEQKQWFARQPKFELTQGNQVRACTELTVATNQVGDTQWRWSLVRPDDGEPLGEEVLRFGVSDKRTKTSQEIKPLRFPEKRLEEIILEAQRRSLPDGSPSKLFSLADLRIQLEAGP